MHVLCSLQANRNGLPACAACPLPACSGNRKWEVQRIDVGSTQLDGAGLMLF
jgi:hypothetical protein